MAMSAGQSVPKEPYIHSLAMGVDIGLSFILQRRIKYGGCWLGGPDKYGVASVVNRPA